jgi:hypothetical protein
MGFLHTAQRKISLFIEEGKQNHFKRRDFGQQVYLEYF